MEGSSPVRRIDRVSAVMVLVTSVALVWTAWVRFGPEGPMEPPAIGTMMPALRLLDLETSEPLVLVGLRGKVVWISFWSMAKPTDLAALETASAHLKTRTKFAMVVAAVDNQEPDRFRRALADAKVDLPAYLASTETRRRFGAEGRGLPLHILVDKNGHVGAVAHGQRTETLKRLANQAGRWLDQLEPSGISRFVYRGDGSEGSGRERLDVSQEFGGVAQRRPVAETDQSGFELRELTGGLAVAGRVDGEDTLRFVKTRHSGPNVEIGEDIPHHEHSVRSSPVGDMPGAMPWGFDDGESSDFIPLTKST